MTDKTPLIIGLLTALFFLFWVYLTYPLLMSDNNAVLILFAERFLDGGTFGQDIFDTNPPFSILIYAPVVWMKQVFGMTYHMGNFLYPLFLLALSLFLSAKALSSFTADRLSASAKTLVLSLFVLGVTLGSPQSWGERDMLAFFGLFPFALTVLTRTYELEKLGKIFTLLASVMGGLLVLLKPHFGLFIAILFLHRAFTQKQIRSSLLSIEFLTPLILTLLYGLLLITLLSGFSREILPDVLALYSNAPIHAATLYQFSIIIGALTLILWGLSETRFKGPTLFWIRFFAAFTMCALVGYLSQGKGLFYHLIPAKTTFLILGTLTLTAYLETFAKLKAFAPVISFILACATFFLFFSPLQNFNRVSAFSTLPFTEILQETCPEKQRCRAFIMHEALNGVPVTHLYADIEMSSRFSSLWWLAPIVENDNTALKEKYGTFLAEDLDKYKPHALILAQTAFGAQSQNKMQKAFHLTDYFSDNKIFKKAMSHYRKINARTINPSLYYRGTALYDPERTLKYDVYLLKNMNE